MLFSNTLKTISLYYLTVMPYIFSYGRNFRYSRLVSSLNLKFNFFLNNCQYFVV